MKSSTKDLIVTIGGTVGILGLAVVCAFLDAKYGIGNSSDSYGPSYKRQDDVDYFNGRPFAPWSSFFMPQSVTESKILAIVENAKDYRYDSDKIRAAKDIYELASGDDSVKQVAIMALQDLSRGMNYDSDRNRVFKLIKEI